MAAAQREAWRQRRRWSGRRVTSSVRRLTAMARAGASEDDTLAGYASRLAAEAHGRIGRSATAARSDSDEQDEDSESVAIDAPMKEMLQKLFGGADGEVVEVKIVVGGEGDVVGGRGGGSATGAIDGLVEHFARVAAEETDDDDF